MLLQCFSSNGLFCLICDWEKLGVSALHPFVVTESLVGNGRLARTRGCAKRSSAAVRAHQTWAVLIKLPSIHPRDLLTPIIRLTPLPSSISSSFSQCPPPLPPDHPVPSSDHGSTFAVLHDPPHAAGGVCFTAHRLNLTIHHYSCATHCAHLKRT